MPSACNKTADSSNTNSSTTADSANGVSSPAQTNGANEGGGAIAAGFVDDDVDYEMPVVVKKPEAEAPPSTTVASDQGYVSNESVEPSVDPNDDSFIFIQDTGFNIKISAPGIEPFELQVSTGGGSTFL